MATICPGQRNRPLPIPAPLDEIYTRIVRAHASLNEVGGDDPERVAWVLNDLMETLRYIEGLPEQPPGS